MKQKTYYNVMRASRMIMEKGYTQKEAIEIAVKIFDEHENGQIPIEYFIEKVITKQEWEKGEQRYEKRSV